MNVIISSKYKSRVKFEYRYVIILLLLLGILVSCSNESGQPLKELSVKNKTETLTEIKLLESQSHELYKLKKFDETLLLLKKRLALQEQVYGTTHQDVADTVSYLGMLLSDMGKLKQAKQQYDRALSIVEQVYGSDNQETSYRLNDVGFVLQAMGKNKQAKKYFKRALVIEQNIRIRNTQY